MTKCKFHKAWIGRCSNEADESGYCEEHKGLKCSSCGAHATHECDTTMGSFVCGVHLCDECEHTLCENGCSAGAPLPEGYNDHCKIGAQVFKSWAQQMVERNEQLEVAECKVMLSPDMYDRLRGTLIFKPGEPFLIVRYRDHEISVFCDRSLPPETVVETGWITNWGMDKLIVYLNSWTTPKPDEQKK